MSKGMLEMTLREFLVQVSDRRSHIGGGAVGGYVGALGAALGAMIHEDREFLLKAQKALLTLAEEDAKAYKAVILAKRMPAESDWAHAGKREAIENALRRAVETPLMQARACIEILEDLRLHPPTSLFQGDEEIAQGLVILCARGALENARINLNELKEELLLDELMELTQTLEELSHG